MLIASLSGWWLGSILFIVIWIALAFWPARVAGRKGHSFFLYFIFSLVFFPAALIVAYLVKDQEGKQAFLDRQRRINATIHRRAEVDADILKCQLLPKATKESHAVSR